MKEGLERKLEGTYEPYQERDRRILERKRKETTSKMVIVRKFLCKIGLHKWSRKTYIDYGPTSNVKTWRRYCKICGKRQSWVQAKGSDVLPTLSQGDFLAHKSNREKKLL